MAVVLTVLRCAAMVVTVAGLVALAVWEWSGGWHDAADRCSGRPAATGTRCTVHRANDRGGK